MFGRKEHLDMFAELYASTMRWQKIPGTFKGYSWLGAARRRGLPRGRPDSGRQAQRLGFRHLVLPPRLAAACEPCACTRCFCCSRS
jgi:hypothetical protein